MNQTTCGDKLTVVDVWLQTRAMPSVAQLGVIPERNELRVEVVGSVDGAVLAETHFGRRGEG